MRGMSIAVIVFGVFSVLGALQQIPQMSAGPPCWTCPDSKIDLAAIAGGNCMDGWIPVGNTYCDDSQSPKAFWCGSTYVYNDQASCEGAGNTWAPYTCEDNNYYWVEENPTSGSSTECSANNGVQAMYSSACCSNDNDGPSAPPFTTPIAFALQLMCAAPRSNPTRRTAMRCHVCVCVCVRASYCESITSSRRVVAVVCACARHAASAS